MRNLIRTSLLLAGFLAFAGTVRAQFVYQGFEYATNANATLTITGYIGAGGAVIVPDSINGLPVTGIGANAFAENTTLTSLAIGANITSIAAGPFSGDSHLSAITVSANNPAYFSLGGILFNKNQTLLVEYPPAMAGTTYTIPSSVTSIGGSAFAGCTLLTNVPIPASVSSLGGDAFANSGLTSVTIPGSLGSIAQSAFSGCGSLATATIAGSVTNLGLYAFYNCASLTNVLFQGNAPIAGTFAFGFSPGGSLTNYYLPGTSGWGASFDLAPAVMLNPPTSAGSLQVTINPTAVLTNGAQWQVDGGVLQPSGATVLGLSVGSHTVSFTAVNDWETPTNQTVSISANATATTSGLYFVPPLPLFTYATNNGAITITGYTGSGGAVTIPGTVGYLPVVSIGNFAFQNSGVTSVTIPNSVTNIGSEAFFGCASLTGFTMPNSVIGMGAEAFASSGLTSVTLSTNLPTIPSSAFEYCASLTSVVIPASVTSLGTQAFAYCASLANVTFPNSIASIGGGAFELDISLASVVLPGKLTSIGNGVFENCSRLNSVTIPNGVASIGGNAFSSDTSLAGVAIPNSVTGIGAYAFAYCSSLASLSLGSGVASIGDFAFAGDAMATVALPASVTSLGEGPFSGGFNLTAFTVNGGNPAFASSGGVLFNHSQTTLIAYPQARAGTAYTIPNSVSSISDWAFEDSALVSVAIPNGVVNIGNASFNQCASLRSVIIPDSVTNLGDSAFDLCYDLTDLTIGDGITSIGNNDFEGTGLISVNIPKNVANIGGNAFYGCTSLTTVTNGSGLVNLGSQAFASCSNLAGVYFIGNAPAADLTVFSGDNQATAYYYYGTTGWGATYSGISTVELNTPTGSVRVYIVPAGAISAGAQWQVDGGTYEGSGAIVSNLPAGSHTISFEPITGWTTPPNQTVLVGTNAITGTSGVYVGLPGALQVTISPAAVVGAGAQWSLNGGGYQGSGAVITNLPATNVMVSFKPVTGWIAPPASQVFITNGLTTAYAVTYADALKPVLTLQSPKAGQVVSNLAFTISGTATDNWQVAGVYYSLNNRGWSNAVIAGNGSNWSAQVTLNPGTNTVAAYAVDPAGNASLVASNTMRCVLSALVTVLTNHPGWGGVSPNDNGASLVIGGRYTLTATAAAGFQFANWTNNFGMVSNAPVLTFAMQSNLVLTASFVDTQKPSLTITAPTAGQRVGSPAFTVTGAANDNAAVASVAVQLNGGNWVTATGTNSWSTGVNLSPGTNFIKACATDTSGNLSPTNSVTFDLVVTNQLGLGITGLGTLSPNYSNAWLEVGRNYTMTAVPAPGFAFTSWTVSTNWLGGSGTNKSTVQFMMASNLTLMATFVDTQKPSLTITAPTAGQRVTNTAFTVRGTASDNAAVAAVAVQVNGGSWLSATGTNNWSVGVNLAPGTNSIMAYALDTSGNFSVTNSGLVDWVVTNQPGLGITGLGTLSPNYSNAWLEVGRNYTMTAVPAPGFVFTNWTVSTNWLGGTVTNKPTVLFMMASNLTLAAGFVETTKPVVTITNLSANQKVFNGPLVIKGTTSDNWLVSNVWCEIGSSGWVAAGSTNSYKNWAVTNLNLVYGTNTVRVYAQNWGGLYSSTNTISVVATNSLLTPNLAGKSLLTPPATVLLVTNGHFAAGGLGFSLQITGGAIGEIQVSANLTDWETLTNFAGTNTTVNFCDPNAANYQRRYYRAVAPGE